MDERPERDIPETGEDLLSECCCAPLYLFNDGIGLCNKCHEWAGVIEEVEDDKETD